jgi:tetratricopeptide (TPR) repeat protein
VSAAAKSNVIHVVFGPGGHRLRAEDAYTLYRRASEIDEDPATYDEAERLYRRAVSLDPLLAIAWSNLGNVLFRRGDDKGAEELYRRAIAIDPSVAEAHYNLGYVMLKRGAAKVAAEHHENAIAIDPNFADAQYNLAMAYELQGDRAKSRPHWKQYLALSPRGQWADIARQYLVETPRAPQYVQASRRYSRLAAVPPAAVADPPVAAPPQAIIGMGIARDVPPIHVEHVTLVSVERVGV